MSVAVILGASSRALFLSRLFVGCAVLLAQAPAWANPFELFGASPRAAALGQTMAARPGDWSALWSNPAAMAGAAPAMGMGTLFAVDRVGVALKPRPAGYDLPDMGSNSPQIPSKYRLQARSGGDELPNLSEFLMGATGSFGLSDLRFGVAVALPMTRLGMQASHFADEREQYASNRLDFELLGARTQHQVILIGLAYQPLTWLAVGAAMSVMPSGKAVSDVYLDEPARQQDVRLSVQNEQVGRLAPILGLHLRPGARWRGGVSYRAANHFDLSVQNRIQINGFQGDPKVFPVVQQVGFVLNYTPDQVDVGVAYTADKWHLAADGVWSRWSQYLDTQGERPNPAFRDTWAVRLGAEYQAAAGRKLRAGVQWEPSPVPDQTGRTNHIDNDRAVASVGGGHPFVVFAKPVELGWMVGLHQLLSRDTNKQPEGAYPLCTAPPGSAQLCDEVDDSTTHPTTGQPQAAAKGLQTGNPGFPGFASFGQLFVFGVDLRWQL